MIQSKVISSHKLKIILFSAVSVIAVIRLIYSFMDASPIQTNSSFILEGVNGNIPISTFSTAPHGLDGISEIRKNNLASLGILSPYKFSKEIFGSDVDKCIWQSKESYYKFNPDPDSINSQGEPLDADLLANPLLLTIPRITSNAVPVEQYLLFDSGRKALIHDYYVKKLSDKKPINFVLLTANAFDLGYKSLKVDFNQSSNLETINPADKDHKIFRTFNTYNCITDKDEDPSKSVNRPFIFSVPLMKLNSLPASVKIDFFQAELEETTDVQPDLSYQINFLIR